MNRKRIFWSVGTVLAAAVLLWAGEPWKEKPYTEWTSKEVQKVSTNSPWARGVRILSGGVNLGQPRQPQGQQSGPSQTVGGVGGGSGGGFGGGGGGQMRFTIQWASSLTIRQALVQRQALRGNVNEEAAAQFLSTTPPQHVIIVFGRDMRGFEEMGQEAVQASAYLKLKGSDRKIPPAQVKFIPQGPRLVAVEFHFPREEEGRPLIIREEKKVKFYCESSTAQISTEFDLRKMTREGDLDL